MAHIGLPKTGTTALQAAFDEARATLSRHGVAFVNQGRHAQAASKAAIGELRSWHSSSAPLQWEQITRSFRESESRCTLLSSETLSRARRKDVKDVVASLGGDIQVVITLRSLGPMLTSSWQQSLRRGCTESLPDWLERQLHPDRRSDESILNGRKGVHRFIEVWGRHVGEDALTFVIADPTDRRSLLASFETLLGLPAGLLPTPSLENSSLPFPEAELLRSFNAAFVAAGGEKDLWMRTVRSTNLPLAHAQQKFAREPLQLPQWAVARSNALTERWIEALDASRATVVGNPEHLLIPTEACPERIEPPTRVDIGSAGAMAHIFYQAGLRGGERLTPQQVDASPAQSDRELGAPSEAELGSHSTRELLAEIGRRTAGRLRRT